MPDEDIAALPPAPGTIFHIEPIEEVFALPDVQDKTKLNILYPLIPPFAYAHIFWDAVNNEILYEVQEPPLAEEEKHILEQVEKGIEELINISFINVKRSDVIISYLEKNIAILLEELGIKISDETFVKIMYYIYRNFVGLNEIEPLMKDYFIEDIECNGFNAPLYIVHRKYRNLKTNIIYKDPQQLASFVEKLAQKCGKYISYAHPILDGRLPDKSVDYSELFIYKKDGQIHISKMGEFIDKYYNEDQGGKPISVKNVQVPTVDRNTFKISWKNVNYVYRHEHRDKLFKVTLENNWHVTVTAFHSILNLTKEGIVAIRADKLTAGNYIPVPLGIQNKKKEIKEFNLAEKLAKTSYKKKISLENIPHDIFERKKTAIKEYLNKTYKHPYSAYYELRKKRLLPIGLYNLLSEAELRQCLLKTTSPVKLPTFLNVDEGLARFVGLYLAEGWLYEVQKRYEVLFSFNKKEQEYIQEIVQTAKSHFNIDAKTEPDKNAVKVKLNSYLLWIVCQEVLNLKTGAHNKTIPQWAFNIDTRLQEIMVKGWWDGDAGCSINKQLIIEMVYLLNLNKKILSYCVRKDRKTKFPRGKRVVNAKGGYTIQRLYTKGSPDYPSNIPMEIFNPLNKTHIELRNKRINRERTNRVLNEARYQRFANIENQDSSKFIKEWRKRGFLAGENKVKLTLKGEEVIKELQLVKKLIKGDVGFVKVKKIEEVEPSGNFVYDLSVEGNENFICGHGPIFCHNSRINATFTQDISTRGPTFTIRRFTSEPFSPVKLMQLKTVSPEMLAYLWLIIEHEANFLVIGGTGSGKTSLLNSLAFFIPPEARVVSIEDTHELNILHENWLPSVAREATGVGAEGTVGEVDLFALLKASFRQRPDYVIVGEIRGKEAYVLFQGAASGHAVACTMHAEDVDTMIRRLETEPINLPASLVEVIDVVCIIGQVRVGGDEVRRVKSVVEIINVTESGEAITNTPFVWDPRTDSFFFKTESTMFNKLVQEFGLSPVYLQQEFSRRTRLLVELYKRNMTDYREVQKIINAYYKTPQDIVKKFNL